MNKLTKGEIFNDFLLKVEPLAKKMQGYKHKVLYGFHWDKGGGTYFNWVFEKFFNIKFDYVVDDEVTSYEKKIYRKNLFDYLRKEETIVFVTAPISVQFLENLGYSRGRNIIEVNKEMHLNRFGYYEWLEFMFHLDLIDRELGADIQDMCKDASLYAISRGIGLPLLCEYMVKNMPESRILDIGCGKGGAVILFKEFGFQTVDGIELSSELCNVARENIDKMGYKSIITECDATKYIDIDKYNLFYIYDSFRGNTFSTVIFNIEQSIERNQRKVYLIYANPWEHKRVVEHGILQLKCQLDGDWFTRMVNIYSNLL